MLGKSIQSSRRWYAGVLARSVVVLLLLLAVILICTSISQGVEATGDLQITADPGLRVYLGEEDNFVGKTNEYDDGLYLEGLPVGPHTVIIKKSGFLPGRFMIEIKLGKAIELTVGELKPDITVKQRGEEKGAEVEAAVGSLKIRSVPLKCDIRFLDRTIDKEKDEVVIEGIPVGTYPIEFRRKAETLTHQVTILANTELELLAHFRDRKVLETRTLAAIIGEMVLIPAGEFLMGSNDGDDHEKPVHKVYLDAFYIDKYEVTNAQFCEFSNDKGNQEEGDAAWLDIDSKYCLIEYRNGKYQPKPGYENHPVVEVTWYGARAYSEWVGKRLPTEAEWEKAARGGLVGKKYPWGDSIDSTKANYGNDVGQSTPVGSYPPNGYGLYDMAGNVWEWVSDWYDKDYYSSSPYENPRGPNNGSVRVFRSGGWSNNARHMPGAERSYGPPGHREYGHGFRCTKSP